MDAMVALGLVPSTTPITSSHKVSIVTVPLNDMLSVMLSNTEKQTLMDECIVALASVQGSEVHPDHTPSIQAALRKLLVPPRDPRPSLAEIEDHINQLRLDKLVDCLKQPHSKVKRIHWQQRAAKLVQNKAQWDHLRQVTYRRLHHQQHVMEVMREVSMQRYQLLQPTLTTLRQQLHAILSIESAVDPRVPTAQLKRLHAVLNELKQ